MFERILIANRGEIACRIVRTARRLGVATVCVYSDADAGARHVRIADQALRIGTAPPSESYLSIDRVIDAAKRSSAQAIHPGYGFLAESAEFAQACEAAGLVFIGPPADAIRSMGSKSHAKSLMLAAGVPVVPGYHGDDQSPHALRAEAARIGYPLLIKATAGGGGKGMRVVAGEDAFDDALVACRREAQAAFGDDRVLLERYLHRPRHIEMQIFADRHGNIVHLFERDCSVQRRHQKVLEEAPAPGLTSERRDCMGRAAIDVARAVGYVGAGTVEFIVDRAGDFHFMEMNTRLQVEHPVTEMVTGLDLVEWQLRIAAGESLPLVQEQLGIHGHALEARIYAEDPERSFLPSTGRLIYLEQPAESTHVRVDSGVEQGDEVGPHYDPMLAKLIVWDVDRDRALSRMSQALAGYRVVGVANNVSFLSRLVACPPFRFGDLDTGIIEREQSFLVPPPGGASREAVRIAALASLLRESSTSAAAGPTGGVRPLWAVRDGWRLNASAQRELVFRCGDRTRVVHASYRARGFRLELDGQYCDADAELLGEANLRVDLDGCRLDASVVVAGERRHVFVAGQYWLLVRVDPLENTAATAVAAGGLVSPMPGRVVELRVAPGERVEQGAALMVIEAMKMEHMIHAPSAGIVRAFRFAPGEQVEDGDELVDFEPVERSGDAEN
ncbi:MAG: acetyl/propionyl/methylcrotonyl-CoA carboxylase subunit alpha [Thermomicrobiales bacterium]|nr:MAG: acetyl/propionyl/methylcrotonyl-CoA carboxylase subunit alpha [Thermomicrobiales bacterium]